MDVREELVKLLADNCDIKDKRCVGCEKGLLETIECKNSRFGKVADHLIANGVTVQEWISVDDELPKHTDEYNVTVGVPSEFGYFETVTTLRFERLKGKEPRWVIPHNEIYRVIAWMPLPKKYQPPKGE